MAKYILKPTRELKHSAKGSEWKKHTYIKKDKATGYYYYPDDYSGGRHIPKDQADARQAAMDKWKESSEGEPSNWQTKFFSDFEKTLGNDIDPKRIQDLLLFGEENGKKYDNFAVALEEIGIKTDNIDPTVLNRMRYKVLDHYKAQFEQEKDNFDKEGNRIKNRTDEQQKKISSSSGSTKKSSSTKNSSKKSSSKKSSKKETDSKATSSTKKDDSYKTSSAAKGITTEQKQRNSSSYWTTAGATAKRTGRKVSYVIRKRDTKKK